MKGLLQVQILVACWPHWEIGEDDFNDHSKAKMGGEPCPTGRANLFDTRKTSKDSGEKGRRECVSLRRRGKKTVYAGVPVYRSTQRKRDTGTCISLISLEK